MSTICQPSLVLPNHCVSKQEALTAMRKRFVDVPGLDAKLRLVEHAEVNERYFVVPADRLFDHDGVSRRAAYSIEVALPLAIRACQQALKNASLQAQDISRLIVVSCTAPGLALPGLDAPFITDCATSEALRTTAFRPIPAHTNPYPEFA